MSARVQKLPEKYQLLHYPESYLGLCVLSSHIQGLTEIALILVVILLLFGGKRIPELAKALGKAQYEYKKAKELLQNEAQDLKDTVAKAAEQEEKKDSKK